MACSRVSVVSVLSYPARRLDQIGRLFKTWADGLYREIQHGQAVEVSPAAAAALLSAAPATGTSSGSATIHTPSTRRAEARRGWRSAPPTRCPRRGRTRG